MSDPTTPQKPSLGIDPYERNWMLAAAVLIVAFGVTVTVAGFALGFQVPGEEARVNPNTVTETPPFDNPGIREIAPGKYEVYMVARTWAFEPRDLTFPLNAEVTFYITTVDVQHGFKLQDTNVNMQVVPGEVSKLTTTFNRVGEYPFICTEFCGLGHAAMFGSLIVEPAE